MSWRQSRGIIVSIAVLLASFSAGAVILFASCISETDNTNNPVDETGEEETILGLESIVIDGYELQCVGFHGGLSCDWDSWNEARAAGGGSV